MRPAKTLIGLAGSLLLAFSNLAIAEPTAAEPVRYYWDLSDLYPTEQAWEAARATLDVRVKALETLKGTLGDSPAAMLRGLTEVSDTYKEAARLYVYAGLKRDEDQRDAAAQERFGQARALYANAEQATSWSAPEILALGADKAERFLREEPGLSRFEFQIRDTLRQAPHTLSTEGEDILAKASLVAGSPGEIYQMYANASIPWPTVTLSDGSEVKLNQAAYSRYRSAPDRDDRKLVFDTFWGRWKEYANGMGATLNAEVQSNVFEARARKFDTALQQNMFADALPPEIYGTLVDQVNGALPVFHRYLRLRGRMLGIDALAYYDIYPALIQADTGAFDLDRSKQITFEALKPFGDTYLSLLREGLDKDWMHSHPQEGKATGAYVNGGAYDVHPYVLLNHNDDYQSLTTFAHEWGHAVHTMLAAKNNPWETYDYSTFLAEMASTINEILLQEYMIANARTKEEKLFYLGGALEAIRLTVFRQTMFAEFERTIHEASERDEPLTGANMTEKYLELLRKYHGEAAGVMKIDDLYGIEWAYIPHFYYDYYVYQYATSMSGAVWFANQFLKGDEKVRDAFIRVLSAGGSDYPHNILLNEAGLDMRKPDAYQAAFTRMNDLMDRIEALLDE
jgi:oligoendopeptidase F